MPEHMQEVSRDLVAAIDETQQGTIQPQRENDELTRALKNLEHPGRARGIGVVLLGPEIPLTRLIERAKPNRKRNFVPCKKR